MRGGAGRADRLPAEAAGQELPGLPRRRAGNAPGRARRARHERALSRRRRSAEPARTANPAILWVPPLPHVLHRLCPIPTLRALPHEKQDKRTFLQKIAEFIHPGPDSKAELIETLADAEDNDIIGAESRVMLEGVIRMADLTAGDVMVAAPRMDLLEHRRAATTTSCTSSSTPAHSRFPVYEGDRENIIGILLAKDLLKLQRAPELNIRALLRPAVSCPRARA